MVEENLRVLELEASDGFLKEQKLLDFLREHHLRKPALVLKHGYALLTKHKSALGEDVWELYERVLLAALDVHQKENPSASDIARECLHVLKDKFGNGSLRIKKLMAMYEEANGNYGKAISLCDEILKLDPVNTFAWKRKIAIMKAQGDYDLATKELTKYLQVFSSEESGWQELAQLYIAANKFELAKFCLEELILLVPSNYLFHLLYAEVLYTLGSKTDFEIARKYFAQSLELKPEGNLRASYGLAQCLKAQGSSKESSAALYKQTVGRIRTTYKKAPKLLPIVEASLSFTPIKSSD